MKTADIGTKVLSALGLLVFGVGAHGVGRKAGGRDTTATQAQAAKTARIGRANQPLPLSFEPNEGQADPAVRYISRGPSSSVLLTDKEAVLSLRQQCQQSPFLRGLDATERERLLSRKIGRARLIRDQACKSRTVRMTIDRARDGSRPEALEELPGKSSYFIGTDRSKWRTGIPNYSRVRYKDARPGVDLIYYGNRGQLEFDLVVAPGTDPETIALKFPGETRINISRDGAVVLGSHVEEVSLLRPIVYQIEAGEKRTVPSKFVRLSGDRVGFRFGRYNRREPLIIDPTLAYSTFVGGTNGDSGVESVAVDSSGDVYVAGWTSSTTFPIVGGFQTSSNPNGVAFVAELDSSASTLLWSTYLGGTGTDGAYGLAIDQNRNVYVTGYSMSPDFPVINGFQAFNNDVAEGNAFVARIDTTKTGPDSLVYSTYLGGGGNSSNTSGSWSGDGDFGLAIAVDSSGHAYVTGVTTSDASIAAFPTTATAFQSSLASPNGNAFLTVIDTTKSSTSSLVYSTYLGGNSPGWAGDYGDGVAIDSSGNAYLVGETTSNSIAPFPTTSDAYQLRLRGTGGNTFLAEIAPNESGSASLLYSTYFGGSTTDFLGDSAASVALDSSGKVYIAGGAASSDFPTTVGAFQTTNSANGKGFVAKFDLTLTGTQSLIYSTFLGGSNSTYLDTANSIVVDANGNSFVAGYASSTDFPTTLDAFQNTLNSQGGWDAFLTQLKADGSGVLYSTYLGGSSHFGGFASTVSLDVVGNAYVGGYTQSSDFPTTSGTYQTTPSLNPDSGFIAKFVVNPDPGITARISPSPNVNGWNNSSTTITFSCIPGAAPIQSCSVPLIASAEGKNQLFSGMVVDTSSATQTASVTLNLDMTAPNVDITSPSDGTTVATPQVTLVGITSDSLSGVAGVTCNGVQATFDGSNFSCTISLVSGSNSAEVTATDLAGNSATSSINVAYLPTHMTPTAPMRIFQFGTRGILRQETTRRCHPRATECKSE